MTDCPALQAHFVNQGQVDHFDKLLAGIAPSDPSPKKDLAPLRAAMRAKREESERRCQMAWHPEYPGKLTEEERRKLRRKRRNDRYYTNTRKPREAAQAIAEGYQPKRADLSNMTPDEKAAHRKAQAAERKRQQRKRNVVLAADAEQQEVDKMIAILSKLNLQ